MFGLYHTVMWTDFVTMAVLLIEISFVVEFFLFAKANLLTKSKDFFLRLPNQARLTECNWRRKLLVHTVLTNHPTNHPGWVFLPMTCHYQRIRAVLAHFFGAVPFRTPASVTIDILRRQCMILTWLILLERNLWTPMCVICNWKHICNSWS